MNEENPFGQPFIAPRELTEEEKTEMKAEAMRQRNLQERAVGADIERNRAEALLKLTQAFEAAKNSPTLRTAIARAGERLAESIGRSR